MTAGDQPLVSVLMTAYNRHQFIREAIESVLASTYTHFELIIVDDASTDNTLAIAKSYADKDDRIRVYSNECNLGDYLNRNKAASYSNGKYLKYLDSDDLIYRNGLELFVSGMEKFPQAALGLCSARVQMEQPYPQCMPASQAQRYHFFNQGFLDCGPTGSIIRKDIFDLLGGFSGERMIGDFELWLKIAAKYDVVILQPALIFWRVHDGQEFFEGLKSGIYLEKMLPLVEKALASPASPLTAGEKEKISRYYRKITARGIISASIKRKDPAHFIKSAKKLHLKAANFLDAVFFMRNKIQ